ncbi:hypothetical protein [Ensifer soli]|uniref:hypothetical protein n=1 Tax=Ciceribacter sp. sgz301302 TaxID=3342379 RepID=UPI0035B9FD8A
MAWTKDSITPREKKGRVEGIGLPKRCSILSNRHGAPWDFLWSTSAPILVSLRSDDALKPVAIVQLRFDAGGIYLHARLFATRLHAPARPVQRSASLSGEGRHPVP